VAVDEEERVKHSWFRKRIADWAESKDRSVGWAKLPTPIGLLVFIGLRDRLREKNLHDTGRGALDKPPFTDPNQADYRGARTIDGTYNDLNEPLMGSIGSRFGRNVPLDKSWHEEPPKLLDPNPRLISRKLLTRETFQPATTLNALAGAWIQFEVHDWFSHGDNDPAHPWEVPLEADDPWPDHPMKIDRTLPDPSSEPGKPHTFVTADTHWWDGSQIYGTTPEFADALRTHEGGKLKIDEHGLPPKEIEAAHIDFKGVAGNFWIGLALLHSLFIREHNLVCDRLHEAYPNMTDQQLYEKARLVVAALMAKIHTIDWTPAIIAHPTTVLALRTNWYGVLGEHVDKWFGRRTGNEVIRGIPGTRTNHHGVPYQLTEEFVAVYRMHPLIPDEFMFRSLRDDSVLQRRELPEVGALEVRNRLDEMSMLDAFYSFGRSHPGAITLHNYPRFLQDFHRPGGDDIDLASIDILRLRERGVPRYNEFRRLFHLKAPATFEEMTDNPAWAEELRQIYGDVEKVDAMIGMYAEPKPRGFGFSDTAFRVFILMASRRLESDRFFTNDYRPEVYTKVGFDWVESNTMRNVLLRHFPQLEPALEGIANPFAPWKAVQGGAQG
jgi:Animal haem peroxidase